MNSFCKLLKNTNVLFENFVNKYLTTYQYFFQNEIHVAQIHQHKQHARKNTNKFVNFNILNLQ
jgi:hypothetical protein